MSQLSPPKSPSGQHFLITRKLSPEEVSYHYTRYLCSQENYSDTSSDSECTEEKPDYDQEKSEQISRLSNSFSSLEVPCYNLKGNFDTPFKNAEFDASNPLTYMSCSSFCSFADAEKGGTLQQLWDTAFSDLSDFPQLEICKEDKQIDFSQAVDCSDFEGEEGDKMEVTQETVIPPEPKSNDQRPQDEHVPMQE